MIDTTGQCSACGQTVGIDTIHTCSPQVTRPRVEGEAFQWRCFHCDEVFTSETVARDHFGDRISYMGEFYESTVACQIKLGAERSMLTALRHAEAATREAYQALERESAEGWKAYNGAMARNVEQVAAAENLGYERGLRDGAPELARLAAEVERLKECGIAFLYAVEGEGICEIPSARDRRVFGNALKDAPHGRCPSCEKPWPAPLDLVAEAHCSCGYALSRPTEPEVTNDQS